MGIKDYLKYIPLEYPQEKSRIYDYVYLDCNYICHYLIYRCKSDTDLYSKIFDYWDLFSSIIKINKEIFLIFDGEYDTEELANPKYQTHLLRAKAKTKSDNYDAQSIGPGSQILKTFRDYLVEVIERYKKINRLGFKIIINSDAIKGEADTKILNTIANSIPIQDNVCICSKDSDMILIGQSLSTIKSIQVDILSNLRPIKFISVNKFKSYGLDYVLMVLLMGNDYLPKISNVTYPILTDSYDKYIKFNKPIITNNQINYNNLVNYISCIISNTDKKIKYKQTNIDLDRFQIYFNNLIWCLKYYRVITNDNVYIQELAHKDDEIKLKNVINIFNFVNYCSN
jgi:5'-3' exonuclease